MKELRPEEYDLYRKGQLPEGRKREIEQWLLEHPLHREALEGLSYFPDELDLTKINTELEQKIDARTEGFPRISPKSGIRRLSPRWLWAAVIAIALSSVIWLFLWRSSSSPEQLYAQYFEPFPNALENIERGDQDAQSLRQKGMMAYERGDYPGTIRWLQEYLQAESKDQPVRFYLAVAQLSTNNPEAAVTALEEVRQSANMAWEIPAKWYLALAYLKLDQTQRALPILEELEVAGQDYATEAKALLRQLP